MLCPDPALMRKPGGSSIPVGGPPCFQGISDGPEIALPSSFNDLNSFVALAWRDDHDAPAYDGQRTWLQFSKTTNLSIEDIVTGKDQWITKYRFATQSEIDYLLDRFGIVETDYTARPSARIGEFVFQVGG